MRPRDRGKFRRGDGARRSSQCYVGRDQNPRKYISYNVAETFRPRPRAFKRPASSWESRADFAPKERMHQTLQIQYPTGIEPASSRKFHRRTDAANARGINAAPLYNSLIIDIINLIILQHSYCLFLNDCSHLNNLEVMLKVTYTEEWKKCKVFFLRCHRIE